MINVSTELRDKYLQENPNKTIVVFIDDKQIPFQNIVAESLELKEALSEDEQIEFVGCHPSQLKLSFVGLSRKLKGKHIIVRMMMDDADGIVLFRGKIKSETQTNRSQRDIVAYDVLHDMSTKNVLSWFNSFEFPTNMATFRKEFFNHININQVEGPLSVDSWIIPRKPEAIEKYIDGEELFAIDVIRGICQLEGVFGIINRDGLFEYRKLSIFSSDDGAFPGADLLPPFIPGEGTIIDIDNAQSYPTYRSVNYNDYEIANFNKVVVRQSSDSELFGTWESGELKNMYIVQGNMFTRFADPLQLRDLAIQIGRNIQSVRYTPFEAEVIGLPFLEVGDAVQLLCYDFFESIKQKKDVFTLETFVVLSRTLKGICSLVDQISARGTKDNIIVADQGFRNGNAEKANEKADKNAKDIEEIKGNMLQCKSVQSLPAEREPNTIYLIQGTPG